MSNQPCFVQGVLRELQSRTEDAAIRHPGLRHMLVLPRGEGIEIPSSSGQPVLGSDGPHQQPGTSKFGETELAGSLPPRTSWPQGVAPLRAVAVRGAHSSSSEESHRIHLFFGGSTGAYHALQRLADDLAGIFDDVTRTIGGDNPALGQGVFYTSNEVLGGDRTERLDSWLCTMHWWAWEWAECPHHTKPQVVYAGSTYETDPHDDAVETHLSFSMFNADVLTASAATLSLILQFLDEPPVPSWLAEDTLPKEEAESSSPSANIGLWHGLSDRQRDCMVAMHALKAFGSGSQQRAADIARKSEGGFANFEGYKEPLADLVHRRLLQSKDGRGGGYRLTDCGLEIVTKFGSETDPKNRP